MRSSVFGKWVHTRRFKAYILVPGLSSLIMMAMYFGGSSFLQAIIAPTIYGIDPSHWTKVGLLEVLQVLLLLGTVFFAIRAFMTTRDIIPRLVLLLVLGATLWTLVQEVDYGNHYQAWSSRPPTPVRFDPDVVIEVPEPASAEVVATQIALSSNLLVLVLLMITPIFYRSRSRTLRLLAPSPWMTAGGALAGVLYYMTWRLNLAGFDIVDGTQGHLHYENVEFLQFSVYYLVLVWVASICERAVYQQ